MFLDQSNLHDGLHVTNTFLQPQIMLLNGWRLRHSKPTLQYIITKFLYEYILTRLSCPQGNGQAKLINNIVKLIAKLVNENKVDWDEHLPTVFLSYITTYKVTTWYIPQELVYGLHPFMPIEYVLPTFTGDHKYVNHVKVLTSRIIKLENLQNDRLQVKDTTRSQQWNCVLWI